MLPSRFNERHIDQIRKVRKSIRSLVQDCKKRGSVKKPARILRCLIAYPGHVSSIVTSTTTLATSRRISGGPECRVGRTADYSNSGFVVQRERRKKSQQDEKGSRSKIGAPRDISCGIGAFTVY